MKKIAIYSASALIVGVIVSPFIGMAIGSTRELILGLAPEEAVLQLADKIDLDRAGVEQKTNELQSLIDAQKSQLAEQQQIIDQQKTELENVKSSSITSTQAQQISQTAIANAEAAKKQQEAEAACQKRVKNIENSIADTKSDIKNEKEEMNCSGSDCDKYQSVTVLEHDLEEAEKDLKKAKEECEIN
ncbi:MAG: hypothetical protein QMD77_01255 [Patescibacteria group bacterium]|nr:hypothetical protein [Patescibacteria group bacterium]